MFTNTIHLTIVSIFNIICLNIEKPNITTNQIHCALNYLKVFKTNLKKKSKKTHILHELFADRSNVLGERGGEHHDLFLVRSRSENLLHVATHICKIKFGLLEEKFVRGRYK